MAAAKYYSFSKKEQFIFRFTTIVVNRTIRNSIRGEESQIFNDKTPYFSKFIGSALVLGSEILLNGSLKKNDIIVSLRYRLTPKTKVKALHF